MHIQHLETTSGYIVNISGAASLSLVSLLDDKDESVKINIFDIVLFQGLRESYKNRITDCLKIKSVKGLYR
jgi:hypothetical protein